MVYEFRGSAGVLDRRKDAADHILHTALALGLLGTGLVGHAAFPRASTAR